MAIKQLTEEQIREWSVDQKDRWWFENVYRGNMPQLTLRAALTGFFLGGILSATNLYVGAKTGWSLGVGITSVILAFAFFKILQNIGFTEFTILENNAMQSIATSAGYMTAPLTSSLAAYMIANNVILPWWQIISWNIVISILGVLFAFPMKRRFINDEQQPFPEGQAAGVVMDTLHSSDASVGLFKAKVLAIAGGTAAFIKFLQSESIQTFLQVAMWIPKGKDVAAWKKLVGEKAEKIWVFHEDFYSLFGFVKDKAPRFRGLHEYFTGWYGMAKDEATKTSGPQLAQITVTPGLDLAMIGAGGLMGIRAGASLMIGAVLNYIILVPWMIDAGDILMDPKKGEYTFRTVTQWSLWPGVAAMVVVSFTALLAKPSVITGAFHGLFTKKKQNSDDLLKDIEFPLWISIVGIPIMSLITAVMAYFYFSVPIWATLAGVPLMFVLSLIAANSTALTATTPVGATSKITQLFYGIITPGNIKANLATAGVTAEVVGNSSNLLMDIKPGYMLGAKPRQQAIGHIIGIFSGAIASTFLFYPLFTKDVDFNKPETIATIQNQFPMPSASVWMGIAKVLTEGLNSLPSSVVKAVIVAAAAGLILEILRLRSHNKLPLSPIAIGLAFVIDFKSVSCMFLGSLLFAILGAIRTKREGGNFWAENQEPICAGIIAGASLMGIADILVTVFLL